jgi:hypothetical protein
MGDPKMLSKLKMAAAAAVAASLFSGASYALETGNIAYSPVNGSCEPNPLTGYPWAIETTYNVPILLGTATQSGDNFVYLTLTTTQVSNLGGGPEPGWTWQYYFNTTNQTYTLLSYGIPGQSSEVSGSYTGTLEETFFGGYYINLKLNCGATLVGGTLYIGS